MFNAFVNREVAYLVDEYSCVTVVPFRKREFLFPSEYKAKAMFLPDKSGAIPVWWEVDGDGVSAEAMEVTLNMLKWKDGLQYCVFVSIATMNNAEEINDLAIKGMCRLCVEQHVNLSDVKFYTKCGRAGIVAYMLREGTVECELVKRLPEPTGVTHSVQEKEPDKLAVVKFSENGLTLGQFPIEWLGEVTCNPTYLEALVYRYFCGSKVVLEYVDGGYTRRIVWDGL